LTTVIERVDPADPQKNTGAIKRAAAVIKAGGLAAFPTETVYGLGADAFNPAAVKKIFAVKGRPADNPCIVHIAGMDGLDGVAADIPPLAYRLAEKFWPGPFTMVLNKKSGVPYETTGGLETVAVRLPANETARLLIREAGTPIAAPSCNISGSPSATRAEHAADDLFGKIDIILDGGPSVIGLESTVADLTAAVPSILRPGGITAEMLIEAEPAFEWLMSAASDEKPKSPGIKYTHYSPKADVVVVTGAPEEIADAIIRLNAAYIKSGKKTGVMATDETFARYSNQGARVVSAGSRYKMENVAAGIYRLLREFDRCGADVILAEGYPDIGLGVSVMDRLIKAAGGNVVRA